METQTMVEVPAIAQPGAFLYWPENIFWSFQLLRLFSQANAGAAELTEIHLVARALEPGDIEGWYAGFSDLGRRVESAGDTAAAADEMVTAREAWKRATNYHRTAGFFLTADDPRYLEAVEARRRAFQKAAPHDDLRVEPLEIPFDGSHLPGYAIAHRDAGPRPKPAVIVFGSADSVCEELYFALGRGLAERGFLAVTVDGPGQGEALRRGMVARADWEHPTGAVIDFLTGREDADPERIGFVGQSLGGLYAVRVAAREPRLRSVVAWGGQWDLQALFDARMAQAAGPVIEHYARWFPQMLGAADLAGVSAKLAPFRAAEDAAAVACPLLIMHGEADTVVPVEHAQRLFDAIPRADKLLRIYRYGEPGCEHCQVDSLSTANREIGSWFARTL